MTHPRLASNPQCWRPELPAKAREIPARPVDSRDSHVALIVCHASLRRGGALKLLKPTRVHMELFVLMRLEGVFETFLDEQEAVNSFFPDRSVHRFDILASIEQQNND